MCIRDRSEDACDEITLYGYYFLENMGTMCYVTRDEVCCYYFLISVIHSQNIVESFKINNFFHFYYQSLQINGSKSVMSTGSYNVRLEERTLFEGYCRLQYGLESSWITKFQFNLSNDGNHYSENYLVYVYDSNCQTFHNDSGDIYFTLQVSQ